MCYLDGSESLNACKEIWCTPGFPGGTEVKASACNVGDLGSIPGSGRSPGEENGNPLQYSYLENPMEGGGFRMGNTCIPVADSF